ncbi:glutamic acid-rich protein-like [Procambarus clarkii]|uniref:glutamic acid-rich protein-like n=1 Tax=Procambarus clarkii TaxID=6728 RepID=UPI0037440543
MDAYPLPRIDDILHALDEGKIDSETQESYSIADRHDLTTMKLKLELAKIEREQQKEALQQQKEALQMKEREAALRKEKQEREAAIKKEQQEREVALKEPEVQESDEVSSPVLVTTRAQAARPQPADTADTTVPQDHQNLPLNLTRLEFHSSEDSSEESSEESSEDSSEDSSSEYSDEGSLSLIKYNPLPAPENQEDSSSLILLNSDTESLSEGNGCGIGEQMKLKM